MSASPSIAVVVPWSLGVIVERALAAGISVLVSPNARAKKGADIIVHPSCAKGWPVISSTTRGRAWLSDLHAKGGAS